jgi:hypothetical protein
MVRVEGHVLIRSRSDVQSELEEDILVGILLAFMVGGERAGVEYRWCPLTQKIGLTSCVVTEVTIRRSVFNMTRRDVRFGHQIKGQAEWSLNNKKDPTLRRMINVLSRMTKGSDLL